MFLFGFGSSLLGLPGDLKEWQGIVLKLWGGTTVVFHAELINFYIMAMFGSISGALFMPSVLSFAKRMLVDWHKRQESQDQFRDILRRLNHNDIKSLRESIDGRTTGTDILVDQKIVVAVTFGGMMGDYMIRPDLKRVARQCLKELIEDKGSR